MSGQPHAGQMACRRWQVVVTNKRVVFLPHFFDAMLKGSTWVADRDQVSKVDTVQPDGKLFSGGLRERVAIHLKDGTTSLFVVSEPVYIVQKLHESGLPK